MSPISSKFGTLSAKVERLKQKKKTQRQSSTPKNLTQTPAPDPSHLDLAKEQRDACFQYLLKLVTEKYPTIADQGEGDSPGMGHQQQVADQNVNSQGHPEGTVVSGATSSAPSSGSQISPLDNTHQHGLPTDGALDGPQNGSVALTATAVSPDVGYFGNGINVTNASNTLTATSTSIGQSQEQVNIGLASASQYQGATTLSPNGTGGFLTVSPIAGSNISPRASSEYRIATNLSPNGTGGFPRVNPVAGLNVSPRASSEYRSAIEGHYQPGPARAADGPEDHRPGTQHESLSMISGLQPLPDQSIEEFPEFRPSLAEVVTNTDREANDAEPNQQPIEELDQNIETRDAGAIPCGGHRPSACCQIDYKQLLEEIYASDHPSATKMYMATELVTMLQEFKNQAYREKADAEAERQTEIDRWEDYYRNRADKEIPSMFHPNDRLIEELEQVAEADPSATFVISQLKQDKERTRKARYLLKKLQKNRQLSEAETLIGERSNSNDSGEVQQAEKERKPSRILTTWVGRKWGSWVDPNLRMTKARGSVINSNIFRPQTSQRASQHGRDVEANVPGCMPPDYNAGVHDDHNNPEANNPQIILDGQPLSPQERATSAATMSVPGTNIGPPAHLGIIVQHIETLPSFNGAEGLGADSQTSQEFSSARSHFSGGEEASSSPQDGTHDQSSAPTQSPSPNTQHVSLTHATTLTPSDVVASSSQNIPLGNSGSPRLHSATM